MRRTQRIFVDDDRVLARRLRDAAADKFGPDHAVLRRLVALGLPARAHRRAHLRELLPPRWQVRARVGAARGQRLRQRIEQHHGLAGDREVAGEAADRDARERRVLADMHDLASRGRRFTVGEPWRVAVDRQHEIGLGQQRMRLEAEMHRMAPRQVHVAREPRYDRQREALGEACERRHSLRRAPGRAGDDQRPLRIGDPLREPLHRVRIGIGRGRHGAGRDRLVRRGHAAAQHLARQREIGGAARRAHHHFHRALDDPRGLQRQAQFVVPLHHLAQHAGLVEHFLRPVDLAVARAQEALLGQGRAPGHQHHRHALALRIDERVDGVGCADIDVHHHRLRPAAHHVDAVRHRDRRVLVRHDHRSRRRRAAGARARQRLDHGRKVGAGIAEQVIDAVRRERREDHVGGAVRSRAAAGDGGVVHGSRSRYCGCGRASFDYALRAPLRMRLLRFLTLSGAKRSRRAHGVHRVPLRRTRRLTRPLAPTARTNITISTAYMLGVRNCA